MDELLEATYCAEQRHFWFHGFRRFIRPLIAQAVAGHAGATILDYGCGTGANLALLADYGRPFGMDLAWLGLQYARQNGHPRLAHASVTRLPFPDARPHGDGVAISSAVLRGGAVRRGGLPGLAGHGEMLPAGGRPGRRDNLPPCSCGLP